MNKNRPRPSCSGPLARLNGWRRKGLLSSQAKKALAILLAVLLLLAAGRAVAAVNGVSANFTNGIITLGDGGASCSTTTKGGIRYNSTSTYMEYCNGSAWSPFEQPQCSTGSTAACWLPATRTSGDVNFTSANIVSGTTILGVTGTAAAASCPVQSAYSVSGVPGGTCCQLEQAVWGDGTYIYMGGTNASPKDILYAYTFNESTHVWTLKSNYTTYTAGDISNIWGDGTYIYIAEFGSGIEAWQFSGTTWTKKGSYSTSMSSDYVWVDTVHHYIYVADDTNGVKAFTFNGSTFTLLGTYTTSGIQATALWGDGTTLYVFDYAKNKVRALTFNGTTFTAGGTVSNIAASDIMGDGTYIYFTNNTEGPGTNLLAYSYAGTTFTLKGSIDIHSGTPGAIFVKGSDIYVQVDSGAVEAYSFSGSSFTYKGSLIFAGSGETISPIWADTAFVFSPDTANYGQYFLSAAPACN